MEKKIITTEYMRDGADYDHTLYLDKGIEGNLQLCITTKADAIHLHIASTNTDYMNWLILHHKSLLIISGENWYGCDNYHEFQRALIKLNALNI